MEHNIYKDIALRIAQLRTQKNLSQNQVAKYLGIAQTTYSSYENGHRKIPLEALNALAYFYEVSPTYLFRGTEDYLSEPKDYKKKILHYYSALNDLGRKKSVEYMEDLAHLKKYTSFPKKSPY